MRRLHLLIVLLLLLAGCEAGEPVPEGSVNGEEEAAFVTLLGDDTLAVERFRRTPEGMEADVVLRTPRTTVRHYTLELDGEGGLERYEAVVREPGQAAGAAPLEREVVVPAGESGDSLYVTVTDEEGTEERMVAGSAEALPFIDMVHWPFELMLRRAHASGQDSVSQELFTARNAMAFGIGRAGEGRMTVTHPYRGTMQVEVDQAGRLVRLDAGETTRALVVRRVPAVDVEAVARRFAARDAAGEHFGPLSGRGQTIETVDGATISVDYGQPLKRGRAIFGGLVAWGERWRTGANQATHFETDRRLDFGGLAVPPGRYTLYTIPEPDGGTLIVNRQTGQGGTSYDEAQDLGRVPMQVSETPETVEAFTIDVVDTAAGGELALLWDRTRFSVSFTVVD